MICPHCYRTHDNTDNCRYKGMTFEEAWADYSSRHPETLATWSQQYNYMPTDGRQS